MESLISATDLKGFWRLHHTPDSPISNSPMLQLHSGQLGLMVSVDQTYALHASGQGQLMGIDALGLSGQFDITINNTGMAIKRNLGAIQIDVAHDSANVDTISGQQLTLLVPSFARLTGDFSFEQTGPPASQHVRLIGIASGQLEHHSQVVDQAQVELSLTAGAPVLNLATHDQTYTWIGPGATLGGVGDPSRHLTNHGLFSPGYSPAITQEATFTQGAADSLKIELGGLTPGAGAAGDEDNGYDQVKVTGLATLGGTLVVELINGFTPAVGQTFDILTFGSVSGKFSNATGLFGFGDGSRYLSIEQQSDRLRLTVKQLGLEFLT